MLLIHGGSSSGKSMSALSAIKNKRNCLYLLLDEDIAHMKRLRKAGIEFVVLKNCYFIDIKSRVLEKGGLIGNTLDYLVIDCLNQIKDRISYSKKVAEIESIERDFGLKAICTINTLKMGDGLSKSIEGISCEKISPFEYLQLEHLAAKLINLKLE